MTTQILLHEKTIQQWTKKSEILSTLPAMDSTVWKLCLVKSLDNQAFEKAIGKLAKETVIPNPFFELPILKSALNNLDSGNVEFLCLSKAIGDEEKLKFFAPVTLSPIGIFPRKVLRSWNHPYSPLGMPLVSKHESEETLKAFIECVRNAEHPEAIAIVFDDLPIEGKFITDLYHSRFLSDRLLLAIRTPRAGLKPIKNLDYEQTYFSGKRKQRLRKARRDLDALGNVQLNEFQELNEIEQPLHEFLSLEEKSWKGVRKTALNNSPSSANFCKEAVRNAISNEKCQINSITLDDKTIASLVTFKSNGYFYPWKISFDEAYAKHSVGNLLTTYATGQFANKECFKGLDSLAAEHNETTLRFWPDDKEFFTMTIGIGKEATQTAIKITNELNRMKRIRVTARRYLKKHSYLERFVSSLRM